MFSIESKKSLHNLESWKWPYDAKIGEREREREKKKKLKERLWNKWCLVERVLFFVGKQRFLNTEDSKCMQFVITLLFLVKIMMGLLIPSLTRGNPKANGYNHKIYVLIVIVERKKTFVVLLKTSTRLIRGVFRTTESFLSQAINSLPPKFSEANSQNVLGI